jgi:hypothetical protein
MTRTTQEEITFWRLIHRRKHMAEVKDNMSTVLERLNQNMKLTRGMAQPLLEKDSKIRKPFQELEAAIKERIQEINSNPIPKQ